MAGVLVEAIMVGLITLVVGVLVSLSFKLLPQPKDPKNWNQYHYMEMSLFITGVLIHLGCEVTGLNAYYCRKGSACVRARARSGN